MEGNSNCNSNCNSNGQQQSQSQSQSQSQGRYSASTNANTNGNSNTHDNQSYNSYNSDTNSYSSYSYNSGSDTGSRKRRTPLSFPLRIHGDGNATTSTTTNYDDETATHTSRDTDTTTTTAGDGTFLSDSTSMAESKAEDDDENDFDCDDLPSPRATAKAATKTNDVNELLSQELLKMSLLDRTDIQEEIHGVRCLSVEETPELIQSSLLKFQRDLDALPDSKKRTYIQIVSVAKEAKKQHVRNHSRKSKSTIATQQQQSKPPTQQPQKQQKSQPEFPQLPKHYAIDDNDFRLRFLRAELFDSKRAVLRFVNYFEFVHEFWGFGIVSKRQVRLSDFSKEELKFFKKGYFQLLPFRDRSGRRVVVILGENKSNSNSSNSSSNASSASNGSDHNDRSGKRNHGSYETSPTTKAKCYFYLWDVASRDSVESQRKGVVAIAHPHGICFDLQNHELYLVHRLSVSVPTRMVASHNFCLDFSGYRLLAKVVVAHVISGGKHKQIIRQKFHVGLNDTEMRYYLQGFGIPIQFFPLTETGTIKLNYFNKWLKTRTYLEGREEEEEEGTTAKKSASQKKGSKKKRKDKSLVVVECPLLNDVVFRQGKPYKANPGNDVLRDSILEELNRKMIASLELDKNENGNEKSNNGHSHKSNGLSNSDHSRNSHGKDSTNGCSSNGGGSGTLDSSTEHFCNWLVEEIEINRKGRFLTWDGTLNSWVQMSDSFKIRRKISVSLYNYEKRHSAALGKKIVTQKTTDKNDTEELKRPPSSTSLGGCIPGFGVGSAQVSSMVKTEEDDLAYRFIEGGKQSSTQMFCNMSMRRNDSSGERKRSRDSFFSQM